MAQAQSWRSQRMMNGLRICETFGIDILPVIAGGDITTEAYTGMDRISILIS